MARTAMNTRNYKLSCWVMLTTLHPQSCVSLSYIHTYNCASFNFNLGFEHSQLLEVKEGRVILGVF